MSGFPNELVADHVRRRFARAAPLFGNADFVHRQAFDGMLERLAPLVIRPGRILDLGTGIGDSGRRLEKTYRKSRVIALDASAAMLRIARRNKPYFSRLAHLRGNALQLPLRTGSIDFVCANLFLPWIDDLPACLAEISRVLKKGGVFAFATLGPDSFGTIRRAWNDIDSFTHIRSFPDMHDVGDALLQNGLADPVLDVDLLSVTYRDTASLYRDLTACGARNSLRGRQKSLTARSRLEQMESALNANRQDGVFEVTLELVYGHAWSTGQQAGAAEFRLDADSIGVRQRR